METGQKIEQPFLKAVKQTLDERCNETIEEIYKIAIKLIIDTIADGYGLDDGHQSAGPKSGGSAGGGGGGPATGNEQSGEAPSGPTDAGAPSTNGNQSAEQSANKFGAFNFSARQGSAGGPNELRLEQVAEETDQPVGEPLSRGPSGPSGPEIKARQEASGGIVSGAGGHSNGPTSGVSEASTCELMLRMTTDLMERMSAELSSASGPNQILHGGLRETLFELSSPSARRGRLEEKRSVAGVGSSGENCKASSNESSVRGPTSPPGRGLEEPARCPMRSQLRRRWRPQEGPTTLSQRRTGDCRARAQVNDRATAGGASGLPKDSLAAEPISPNGARRPLVSAVGSRNRLGDESDRTMGQCNDMEHAELTSSTGAPQTVGRPSSTRSELLRRRPDDHHDRDRPNELGGDCRKGARRRPDDDLKASSGAARAFPAAGSGPDNGKVAHRIPRDSADRPAAGASPSESSEADRSPKSSAAAGLKWARANEVLSPWRSTRLARPLRTARSLWRRRWRLGRRDDELSRGRDPSQQLKERRQRAQDNRNEELRDDRLVNLTTNTLHRSEQAAAKLLERTGAGELGEFIKMLILINKLLLALAPSRAPPTPTPTPRQPHRTWTDGSADETIKGSLGRPLATG